MMLHIQRREEEGGQVGSAEEGKAGKDKEVDGTTTTTSHSEQ